MPIQYNENGLTTQTLAEIVTERETSLQPTFGSDFAITGDTAIGNIQGADSDREIAIQDLLAYLVLQMSVENSSGIFLDWNAKFKNQTRLTPFKTTITRTINGTIGTVISANSLTITNQENDYDFILSSTVTIGSTGKVQGTFESMFYEPVTVNSGDEFTIATPIAGVTSISYTTGDSTVKLGSSAETDEEFKQRIANADLSGSIGISQAIVDKIRKLEGVEACSYIENRSSTNFMYDEESYVAGTGLISIADDTFIITGHTDAVFLTELDANYQLKWDNDIAEETTGVVSTIQSDTSLTLKAKNSGDTLTPTSFEYAEPTLPPNSFEIIVLGGTNSEIAQTIFDNMIPTVQTYGITSASATDSEGVTETIYFTAPTEIAIEMEFDYYLANPTQTLSSEEQLALKQEAVDYWTSLKDAEINKGIGLDMDADDFAQISNSSIKVKKIRSIFINRPSEAQTDYIAITKREIATLSTGDITINLAA